MQAEKLSWLQKKNYEITAISPLFKQQLSHQLIAGQFIKVKVKNRLDMKQDVSWVTIRELKKFAFPKFINQYLKDDVEQ
jgi:A/G-specific adenine glycosylase